MAKGDKLSLKQRLFVEAYVGKAAGNATEAARLAGYKGSDRTLKVIGSENLTKPDIRDAVSVRVDKALKTMSADEVIAELVDIGKAPWSMFSSAEIDRDGNVIGYTLRVGDKIRALELLGKYHKLFTEKVEHSGSVDLNLSPEQKAARLEELVTGALTRRSSGAVN